MDLGSRGVFLIDVAKTKALVSCMVTEQLICMFVLAYAKSRFSHDGAKITAMILNFRTDRSGRIVQNQIRLLLEKQSDQVFTICNTVCIFWMHFSMVKPFLAHLSRRLIGELIVYQWSSVRRRLSSTILKHLLLRNRLADQSQILCGASLGRGNVILFATSGSHDQDGRHAHIW